MKLYQHKIVVYILLHTLLYAISPSTFIANTIPESKAELSGKVIDSLTQNPMSYVTVGLYDQKDSLLVTGTVTDDKGEFLLKNVSFGNYYLQVSFIGYTSKYYSDFKLTEENDKIKLGFFQLAPAKELLESVEINADKPLVTYEIDKKVVNVEDMNTVASATALEVLENIPSITVDIDGNVSLRGSSGFTLLIDNVPTNMPASEALQLISASNIKDIEIITNPSAKYDAEGTSGIINIILKKNRLEGISTLINANVGNFNSYGGDILTSINKGKVKFNIGGHYRNFNRYRDISQERITTITGDESKVLSSGLHRFFRTNYGINTALEYSPNSKNIISLSLEGNQRQYNAAANYNFEELLNDSLTNAYENREQTLRQFYGFTPTLSYQHFIGGNKKHFISFTGMYNHIDGNEKATTAFFDSGEQFQGGNQSTEVGPSRLLRINLDYEIPIKKKYTIQTGIRTDFANNGDDQNLYEYNFTSESYEILPLFSSDVSYLQNVYAGYGIFRGKAFEKLGYQLGIRGEYTDRFIKIETGNLNTDIERMDWFPSAHFSYALNDLNQFKANFSRRIQRPRSWNLEPFISWEDPYTVRQGNPDLLPEYIQLYELGWIRKLKKHKRSSFSLEFYYRKTNNIIQRIQEVFDTNVIVKRPINAGTAQAIGNELSFNHQVVKWWSVNIGSNLFYYKITGSNNGLLDQENVSYNIRIGNNINLPKEWKVQFTSRYVSQQVTVQGRSSDFLTFDLAVKKDFWDNKLVATFQLRNVFNTEEMETWVATSSLYSYRLATPKWPVVSLAISLRLNNYSNQDKIKTVKGDEF